MVMEVEMEVEEERGAGEKRGFMLLRVSVEERGGGALLKPCQMGTWEERAGRRRGG